MVDVTPKDPSHRRAVARGRVHMQPETTALVARGSVGKGDVLNVARVAGIQAAKRTSELIPMCHQIALSKVEVALEPRGKDRVEIEARVRAHDRTGVEMEALTAASVAALTLYDMLKAIDRGMVVEALALHEKTGGVRGDYRR
jgi:cyclic pyranopterin phosphate synthase